MGGGGRLHQLKVEVVAHVHDGAIAVAVGVADATRHVLREVAEVPRGDALSFEGLRGRHGQPQMLYSGPSWSVLDGFSFDESGWSLSCAWTSAMAVLETDRSTVSLMLWQTC
jgi:hypothetical protein